MQPDWVEMVLSYWFGECDPQAWFERSDAVDAVIGQRFRALRGHLCGSFPHDVALTAEGSLAAIVVLDQFSRNLYRGSGQAFAADGLALWTAERAIAQGFDRRFDTDRRQFFYMPFEHSEDRAAQARSIKLFASLQDEELIRYAHRHKEIVDRFGRFPHRNVAIGRISTPDEIEFLKDFEGF